MIAYERIKLLSKSDYEDLKKCGILKHDTDRHLLIYEHFNLEIECGEGRMQAYINTGSEFFTSDSNVRKIVEKMSRKIS